MDKVGLPQEGEGGHHPVCDPARMVRQWFPNWTSICASRLCLLQDEIFDVPDRVRLGKFIFIDVGVVLFFESAQQDNSSDRIEFKIGREMRISTNLGWFFPHDLRDKPFYDKKLPIGAFDKADGSILL